MKTRSLKIHQTNMYCQKCFNNAIIAISAIDNIKSLDIDMVNKNINIIYKDSTLDNERIRNMINKAITTGHL